MRRTETKNAGPVRRGAAAAARAIGRAFGLLGKIHFRRRKGCTARENTAAGRARRRHDADRNALENEISRLEGELDRVYAQIVQGAGSVKRNESEPSTPQLAELIEFSREIREQLCLKRADLNRLERDSVREMRLQHIAEPDRSPGPEQDSRRNSPRPAQVLPGPDSFPANDRVRKSILRAAQNSPFSDSAQQVVFSKLVQDLVVDDSEVRRSAAARLAELKAPVTLEVLYAVLEDPDDKVRVAALNSLALMGDRVPPDWFRQFLESADHHLRLASLRGLSRAGGPSDDLLLIAALEDAHPAVRKAAANYLGWRGARDAVRALVSALHDGEAEVRAAAATSLANLRDDRAVLSLIRLLADPDRNVRETAKKSLESILGEKVDMDISSEGETLERRLDELKEWWKRGRVDKHLKKHEADAVRSEPEPTQAVGTPSDTAAKEDPGKIVELKSRAPVRAQAEMKKRPAGTEKPKAAKDEAAHRKLKKSETVRGAEKAEAKTDEMPEGLEGLGTVNTADESEAEEAGELPEELEELGTVSSPATAAVTDEDVPSGLDDLGVRVSEGNGEEESEEEAET